MLVIPKIIKRYASEDIKEALKRANRIANGDMSLVSTSFERGEDNPEADVEEYSVWVQALINVPSLDESLLITFEYVVVGDDVYMGGDLDSWAESLVDRYNIAKKRGRSPRSYIMRQIESSSKIQKRRKILGADDDIEFQETFDDLADTVNDMQEHIEAVDEDDVDIEIDNNITNHYIAECDKCQGVFISALKESDQEVEKISGICPLCQKRTDQYFRWIIKDM